MIIPSPKDAEKPDDARCKIQKKGFFYKDVK